MRSLAWFLYSSGMDDRPKAPPARETAVIEGVRRRRVKRFKMVVENMFVGFGCCCLSFLGEN